MDPEPKSLRLFILVATFFVIFGCVATYFFWLMARTESGQALVPRALDGTSLHAVAFLPTTPTGERERLTGLVVAILGPGGAAGDPAAAERGLVEAGERAVPPLLDALYRLSLGTGFESPKVRSTLRRVERILDAIARRVPPQEAAPAPEVVPTAAETADADEALKHVEVWFRWWEVRRGATGR